MFRTGWMPRPRPRATLRACVGDSSGPVVRHAVRPARREREQCGVTSQHRGVLLLAPGAAAGLGLDDADLVEGEGEGAGQRGVDVVQALQRSRHRHPAVGLRDRDHRLGLDVDALLGSRPGRALNDDICLGKAGLRVALRDLVAGEARLGCHGVQDRRQRLRVDTDRRASGGRVGCRHEHHRLRVVADLVGHEDRLVVVHQADDVLAGDVGGGDHDDAVPVERGIAIDRKEVTACLAGAHGHAVPGALDHEASSRGESHPRLSQNRT